MSTQELLAMRDRFADIRLRTPVSDVQMGEVLTDAIDAADELANLRRVQEMRLLDEANASHEEFTAYWIDRFSLAGSATVNPEELVA